MRGNLDVNELAIDSNVIDRTSYREKIRIVL